MPKSPKPKSFQFPAEITEDKPEKRESPVSAGRIPETKNEDSIGTPAKDTEKVVEVKKPSKEQKDGVSAKKDAQTKSEKTPKSRKSTALPFDVDFSDIMTYGEFTNDLRKQGKSKTVNTSIALEQEMRTKLEECAAKMQMSVTKLISVMLYKLRNEDFV